MRVRLRWLEGKGRGNDAISTGGRGRFHLTLTSAWGLFRGCRLGALCTVSERGCDVMGCDGDEDVCRETGDGTEWKERMDAI